MFGFLFRRAQATVDNAIGQVVNGSLVIVPLLVAAGFGTAAAVVRLNQDYPPEISYLIIAGVYAALAILAAIYNATRANRLRETETVATPASETASDERAVEDGILSAGDRELLITALSSAAPLALPAVFRTALRNLPIILVVLIASFVLTRPTPQPGDDTAVEPQPAE